MMTLTDTALPEVVSRAEWLAARKVLLAKEKALTRQRDAVNAERRRLPMVKIDKPYVFDGPAGKASLLDLFAGRRQLIVYHFMFDPAWDEGCPSCSLVVDNLGHLAHLHARRTSLAVVSRAPRARFEPYRRRMGWTFPWYSSFESDFNYDFHVTHDEAVAPVEYNYLGKDALLAKGEPWFTAGESHGSERLPARREERLPHLLDVRARLRSARRDVQLPRPDAARPAGGLGGAVGPQRRAVHALGTPSRPLRAAGGAERARGLLREPCMTLPFQGDHHG